MNTLLALFEEIEAHHSWESCNDSSAIDSFEKHLDFRLPSDLKAFHRHYQSVSLFDDGYGARYRFVPISEIHPTRIDIYGMDTDEWGPGTWLTICDVLDGNYLAIDVATGEGDEYNYIDCFHETFARPGECDIVARTFTELLQRALHGGGNVLYFEQKGFVSYGDARPLTAENAAIRIAGPKARKKGWLVKFTLEGMPYSQFFTDQNYGGEKESFEAVRRYIEEVRK